MHPKRLEHFLFTEHTNCTRRLPATISTRESAKSGLSGSGANPATARADLPKPSDSLSERPAIPDSASVPAPIPVPDSAPNATPDATSYAVPGFLPLCFPVNRAPLSLRAICFRRHSNGGFFRYKAIRLRPLLYGPLRISSQQIRPGNRSIYATALTHADLSRHDPAKPTRGRARYNLRPADSRAAGTNHSSPNSTATPLSTGTTRLDAASSGPDSTRSNALRPDPAHAAPDCPGSNHSGSARPNSRPPEPTRPELPVRPGSTNPSNSAPITVFPVGARSKPAQPGTGPEHARTRQSVAALPANRLQPVGTDHAGPDLTLSGCAGWPELRDRARG